MWILPKNYQLTDPSTSSAFVADTVASREDLTLLAPLIESSLMWRSKPSPLRTWQARWSRVSWMPHLFTRTLKPSQRISFEAALTSSLADIRASRSVQREGARVKMIPAISGPTSENISTQLNLFNVSLKTSKDTSRLDSPLSSAIWKKMVTTQRGEYSQRLRSEPLTNASESTSWPTPSARDWKDTPGMAKTSVNHDGSTRNRTDQLARAVYASKNTTGCLNPTWVEWLMGVPTGLTELGCWETE